VYREDCQAYR